MPFFNLSGHHYLAHVAFLRFGERARPMQKCNMAEQVRVTTIMGPCCVGQI
jgi:hypothetical protein